MRRNRRKRICLLAVFFFGFIIPVMVAQEPEQESKEAFDLESAAEKAQSVVHFPSYLGAVEFQHRMHFEEIGLACSECHHETNAHKLEFSHKNLIPTYRVDCQICHHEGRSPLYPQACSNCHHPTPSSNTDETVSSKVALHQDCWRCHEIQQGVEASANCKMCHTGPKKEF